MNANVYMDDEDVAINESVAHQHFEKQLSKMGLVGMTVVIKRDARFRGRRPLLCIDGGKLSSCPTS